MSAGRAPRLYLITDRHATRRPLLEVIAEVIAAVPAGQLAIQLREKDLAARELFVLARSLLELCRPRGVPLLVNGRVDVALALGVGVHLGGDALTAREARALLGSEALLGVSCHTIAELEERAEGADFATYGPLFETESKRRYGPPIGVGGLGDALAVGLPLVGLGGVTASGAAALSSTGLAGVGCIRAVIAAEDPGAAALSVLHAFESSR